MGGDLKDDAGTTPVDSGGAPSPLADAGVTTALDAAPDVDNGAPSETYPAFPVDVAQITHNGGSVLAAPVVVTITWSTDTSADTYNAFGDSIGASSYWSTINSQYGVGAATSGPTNHVSITTAPPTSFADTDLDALVESSAGTSWPAYTANTIYALYLPPGSTLTSGGQDLCQEGVGGYHTQSQNKNYVYAIMPHCSNFQTSDVEDAASHELNEASTDPDGETGWVSFDTNHLAFEFFNQFQDELGDACESFANAVSLDSVDFTPYTVQRQWSNSSAAAGSHWCVPALDEPWYNTTFLPSSPLDTINVDLNAIYPGAGTATSKGLKMALNTTRTIPLGLFSDKATSGPFTLAVTGLTEPLGQDENGNAIANGAATVTLDLQSGVNGQIANLTVTPTAYSSLGVVFFYVRASLSGSKEKGYLPVLVSEN